MKIASLGECMVELLERGPGLFTQSFGGDTLNTAVYLARLGIHTDYLTALGDDRLSDAMIALWRNEGLGVSAVKRIPGRLPGLYMIQVDDKGERSFLYWRDQAPARDFFNFITDEDFAALAQYDWFYLSGITLSLYDVSGRQRLIELLTQIRKAGGHIAFDGNYRPRGWPNRETALQAFKTILPHVDLALPTFDDEKLLFGDRDPQACITRLQSFGIEEIVIKSGPQGCLVVTGSQTYDVPAEPGIKPIDTTAAGDSFNAGYLASRLQGQSPLEAARAGHRLAALVICYPGAIIPQEAMRTLAPESMNAISAD